MLTSLLSACSSWFQPKTKTIEYDEEVKLHNGEMIWVHITRHYFLAGEVTHGASYMPSAVEISWDTGFPGVGRKSVFFQEDLLMINKYQNKWYVVGGLPYSKESLIADSVNCRNVGVQKIQICIASINRNGDFVKVDISDISNFNRMNIFKPVGIKDWGLFPVALEGKKISWSEKLDLQSHQKANFQKINKPIAIFEDQEK